jgi:3-carboxy-cis,cis-muconate cycloisomerase
LGPQRFEMLVGLYGDGPVADILSEGTIIRSWLRVEAALARAQADLCMLDREHATGVRRRREEPA